MHLLFDKDQTRKSCVMIPSQEAFVEKYYITSVTSRRYNTNRDEGGLGWLKSILSATTSKLIIWNQRGSFALSLNEKSLEFRKIHPVDNKVVPVDSIFRTVIPKER